MGTLVAALSLGVGLFFLSEGAKLITDTASVVAREVRLSRFVVSALLVSTLAALPELLVSLAALERGSPELAVGNALGSNIVNLSFIIGLAAVIRPVRIDRLQFLRDGVFLLTITLVAAALVFDGELDRRDGTALLLLFFPYAANLLAERKGLTSVDLVRSIQEARTTLFFLGRVKTQSMRMRTSLVWLLGGIVLAIVGAELVTRGAIEIARVVGASEWVIGVTIVAVGTSLPDMAAAYRAAHKGHEDVAFALGIGANLFSILITLGIMGLVYPSVYGESVVRPTLIIMSIQAFMFMAFMLTDSKVTRREGWLLFSVYPIYLLVDYLV
ncbi:MAG: sodium:calcium antiporter [Methanobacteriota archaeon]